MDDIFNDAVFERDQREVILAAIRASNPDFVPTIKPPQYGYVCNLLEGLNHPDPDARVRSSSYALIIRLSHLRCGGTGGHFDLLHQRFLSSLSVYLAIKWINVHGRIGVSLQGTI